MIPIEDIHTSFIQWHDGISFCRGCTHAWLGRGGPKAHACVYAATV